ncbi:hypothetical protein BGZ58_007584 [Dissophora ornata]|nr:hypothetical protein BGZ58_007584 [Dissophora ornata]
MRVAQNPANRPFVEWLLRIGEPTVSSGTTTDYGKIPDECLFQPPDLIRANNSPAKGIYPNIETTGIQANLFNAFDNQATKMLHGGKHVEKTRHLLKMLELNSKAPLIDVLNAASSRIECELFMANHTKDAEGKKAQAEGAARSLSPDLTATMFPKVVQRTDYQAILQKHCPSTNSMIGRTVGPLRERSLETLVSKLNPAEIIVVHSIRNKIRRTQQEFVVVMVDHSYFALASCEKTRGVCAGTSFA